MTLHPNYTLSFFVEGKPVAKQSFRYRKGGGYQSKRVKTWQECVAIAATVAMGQEGITEPLQGRIVVKLDFYLPDKRLIDCDNLSKGVLDALKYIAYNDDALVEDLHVIKHMGCDTPGVDVSITGYRRVEQAVEIVRRL